ncbi:zinc-binding dehydrogenase [Acidithiobacillus sp.]
MFWSILKSNFTSRSSKFVAVRPNITALRDVCHLIEEGKLKTKIDKIFNISEIIQAHKYRELSRTCGKVIIQINDK